MLTKEQDAILKAENKRLNAKTHQGRLVASFDYMNALTDMLTTPKKEVQDVD